MHRFFVPPEWLAGRDVGDEVHLEGPVVRQLARVLRARPGEHITLLDDTGWAYEAVLGAVAPGAATACIVARANPPTEPRLDLTLYQALPKHRKFDWILQKGTELGVSTFAPVITRHSDVRRSDRSPDHKVERWQRIVAEAAEQSGRTRRPRVLGVQAFEEACETPPEGVLALMPYEGEQEQSLATVLRRHAASPPQGVRLYIGPEGGYDPQEVAWARDRGVERVSLGPRILRAETAALAAVAIVLYALEDAAS